MLLVSEDNFIKNVLPEVTEAKDATPPGADAPENRQVLGWGQSLGLMGLDRHVLAKVQLIVAGLLLLWIGQWLFLAGFLMLAAGT